MVCVYACVRACACMRACVCVCGCVGVGVGVVCEQCDYIIIMFEILGMRFCRSCDAQFAHSCL